MLLVGPVLMVLVVRPFDSLAAGPSTWLVVGPVSMVWGGDHPPRCCWR
jgi:hypothetical protein